MSSSSGRVTNSTGPPTRMFRGLTRATDASRGSQSSSEHPPPSRFWGADTHFSDMDTLWEEEDDLMTEPSPVHDRDCVHRGYTSPWLGCAAPRPRSLQSFREQQPDTKTRSFSEPPSGSSSFWQVRTGQYQSEEGEDSVDSEDRNSQHSETLVVQTMIPQLPATFGGVPVTTLVLRNLPPHLTQREFLQRLPQSVEAKYNVLHVPLHVKRRHSSGYAFINFETHEDATAFFSLWNGQLLPAARGDSSNMRRIIKIEPAEHQGFFTNLMRWRRSMRHLKDPALLPAIFVDGQRQDFRQYVRGMQIVRV